MNHERIDVPFNEDELVALCQFVHLCFEDSGYISTEEDEKIYRKLCLARDKLQAARVGAEAMTPAEREKVSDMCVRGHRIPAIKYVYREVFPGTGLSEARQIVNYIADERVT